MSEQQAEVDIPPLTKSVTVDLAPEAAFKRFTEDIAEWWPMAAHSVGGDKTKSVAFETHVGGRLFETQLDGTSHPWGRVTEWNPPHRVAFTWHPGRDPDTAQRIEVVFVPAPAGGGTRVTLTHHDWQLLGSRWEETRDGYDKGWDGVLGQYSG